MTAAAGVDVQLDDGVLLERYRYAPGPAGETPLHVHDGYQWCLSIDFPGRYVYRGATLPMPPGALSILHPGEPHSCRDPHARTKTAHYLVAYFPVARFAEIASDINGRAVAEPFFGRPVLADRELRSAYTEMHLAAARAPASLEHDGLQLSFTTMALRRHARLRAEEPPKGRDSPIAVRTVRDYLREHTAETVRLSELAELVAFSPYHLHRTFTRSVGMPPHRYQLGLRIEAAKRLLATETDLARTAATTGFADYSHFSRHFTRTVGFSPARYRVLSKNVQDD